MQELRSTVVWRNQKSAFPLIVPRPRPSTRPCLAFPLAIRRRFRHNTRPGILSCQNSSAFFSGLPSACWVRLRWPPSPCIAANRSMPSGWSWLRCRPTLSAIVSTAVLLRRKCWRSIRCALLPPNVSTTAATSFPPISGSSSDTTSPPSPAPDRWSAPCSPPSLAISPVRSGLSPAPCSAVVCRISSSFCSRSVATENR